MKTTFWKYFFEQKSDKQAFMFMFPLLLIITPLLFIRNPPQDIFTYIFAGLWIFVCGYTWYDAIKKYSAWKDWQQLRNKIWVN